MDTHNAEPQNQARILIVDDHPIVRQGLSQLINQEDDLEVCGTAGDGSQALKMITELDPDLVILDISLEGTNGLDLIKQTQSRAQDLPILILSMHNESIYAERALRAGANGYIMKQEATEAVVVAIRQVLDGMAYLSEPMKTGVVRQIIDDAQKRREDTLARLSDRELEVFRLIGEGNSTRQIADQLHLAVKTIESYRAHIKEKMKLENATQLTHAAIQWRQNQ